jgi:hypothetical protein
LNGVVLYLIDIQNHSSYTPKVKKEVLINQNASMGQIDFPISHIHTKTNNFILIFLATLLGLIIAIIIISLNRGFNFTDEGGFLLSYKNVIIYRGGIYNYHIIITKLTDWLNPGIKEYRWLSLILTILSSFTLAIGLYKWLNANYKKDSFYKNFIFIFCFISIGNFLFYFLGLQTIYNNTLTNFVLQVASGLILYLFSYDAGKLIESKTNIFLILIIGFICAFSFFIKLATGVFQLAAYFLLFSLYLKEQTIKQIFIVIFTLCIGTVLGILFYLTLFQGYTEWIFNFKREYFMLSDHSPNLLVKQYFYDIVSLIKFSMQYFSWLIIFPLFIFINNYFPSYFKRKNNKCLISFVLLFSVAFFIYEIYHFNFYRSTFANGNWINAYFYIIVISLQLFLLFAIGLSKNIVSIHFLKINFNKVLIIFLLLITPFIGAIGTANPIFLNTLIHSAPWFGIIVILLIYLSEHIKSRIILSLFIIIPSLVTTSQILDGNIFIPYYSVFNMNKSNFFQQTEQIEDIPLLKGIYVDIKTKTFLLELKQLLINNNYRKGYPIFGFHIPGIIFLLEGISPGMPYYFNNKRDLKAFECFKLQNNPPIIMVTEENPINDELLKTMKTKGINFPHDYLLKGEVYFPNTKSMLKVYFPKSPY